MTEQRLYGLVYLLAEEIDVSVPFIKSKWRLHSSHIEGIIDRLEKNDCITVDRTVKLGENGVQCTYKSGINAEDVNVSTEVRDTAEEILNSHEGTPVSNLIKEIINN